MIYALNNKGEHFSSITKQIDTIPKDELTYLKGLAKLTHNEKIINQLNNLPNSFLVSIINVPHNHFQIIDSLYI